MQIGKKRKNVRRRRVSDPIGAKFAHDLHTDVSNQPTEFGACVFGLPAEIEFYVRNRKNVFFRPYETLLSFNNSGVF